MNKWWSARFWMALSFSFTTCAGFLLKLISGELFVGIVMLVVSFYFSKERQPKGDNTTEEVTTTSTTTATTGKPEEVKSV
jgi:hypothetical protein